MLLVLAVIVTQSFLGGATRVVRLALVRYCNTACVAEVVSAALDPTCFKAVHRTGDGLELVQVTSTPVIFYCSSKPG